MLSPYCPSSSKAKHYSLASKAVVRKINPTSGAIGSSHYHRYKDKDYRYDVWSNVHYGYVGRVCGFSEATLIGGASAAQFFTDDTSDPPSDETAIRVGFELYQKTKGYPATLTGQMILDELEKVKNFGHARLRHVCLDNNGFTPE
jgi:hypothetical protein